MTEVGESGGPDADPIELPIDGILDLHAFRPADVADLVDAYLDECVARGIDDVRIVHGKGTGTLRRIVRGVLDRRADVASYGDAGDASGWGATIVRLDQNGKVSR